MDQNDPSHSGGALHGGVGVFVRDAPAPAPLAVAHHDLEGGDAGVHGLGDFGQIVEVLEDPGVEGEIGHATRLALLAAAVEGAEHGFVLLAGGVGDHGCDAAVDAAARDIAQGVALGRKCPEVDVGVDRAGEDEPARQVHHLFGGRGLPGRASPGDPSAVDADGGGAGAAAENNGAAREEPVEGRVAGVIGHHAHSFIGAIQWHGSHRREFITEDSRELYEIGAKRQKRPSTSQRRL